LNMNRCEALTKHTLRAGIVSGNETIDAIVAETSRNRLLYPAGVRADSHFLTSSGELVMRMRQGMGMGSEDEAEVGNASYGAHGVHGGQRVNGGGQDRKGKGISTTFNSVSSPHPISTPAKEGQGRGFKAEKGFGMYTPSTNQGAQLGNAWDGEMDPNPKWKGKGKEVEHGFNGNGGSGWNNTHNSHSQPHPQINRAHSNAGPSYHQHSYVATNPNTAGGWMNNPHPQPNVMHSNATGPSHHQNSYGVSTNTNTSGWIRVNNPHPQHLSSTSTSNSTCNNAIPSSQHQEPTNTDFMNSIDNAGVGSNPQTNRAPIHSDTMNPNPKTQMKAEPKTREEAREEMNGNGSARDNGMEMEKGKGNGKAEGEAEGEVEVQGGGGNKTPFFDKQTGGWREVEVVDLCGDE
jgi:hypothetical protein